MKVVEVPGRCVAAHSLFHVWMTLILFLLTVENSIKLLTLKQEPSQPCSLHRKSQKLTAFNPMLSENAFQFISAVLIGCVQICACRSMMPTGIWLLNESKLWHSTLSGTGIRAHVLPTVIIWDLILNMITWLRTFATAHWTLHVWVRQQSTLVKLWVKLQYFPNLNQGTVTV